MSGQDAQELPFALLARFLRELCGVLVVRGPKMRQRLAVCSRTFPLHYNESDSMVRDAYFYAVPLLAVALLVGWLASPAWSAPALLLAAFFLWFFRDPDRLVPRLAGAVVSPADGKVTAVSQITEDSIPRLRISIFLSVFDVHVNRSPIRGVIRKVNYRPGKFLNAMNPDSASQNEQNIVTVEADDQTVIFKQIAGLLARRIVFNKKVGDPVERGERVGMIKFGSRVDILLHASASVQVKVGDRVQGGSSVLAFVSPEPQLAALDAGHGKQGAT
jgi:phosphatidylserine decarboxylase